jgi:ATP-binding cassette subfamily B protein
MSLKKSWMFIIASIKEFSNIFVRSTRVIFKLNRHDKINLLIGLILILGVGFFTNIPSLILGNLVNFLMQNSKTATFKDTLMFLALIVGAIILREVMTVGRKYIIEKTCTRVQANTLINTFGHLIEVDLGFLTGENVGVVNARLHQSIEAFIRLIKLSFLDFLPSISLALFAIGMALTRAPYFLVLIMVGVLPITLLVVMFQVNSQKGIRLELIHKRQNVDGFVVELINGIEFVRASHTEAIEIRRITTIAQELQKQEFKHHLYMMSFDTLKSLIEATFLLATIISSVYLAIVNVISFGDILTFSLLYMSITNPLREIHRFLDEGHEACLKVDDLYNVLNRPRDISYNVPINQKSEENNHLEGNIAVEFRNVSFSYPWKLDKKEVLKDISFKVYYGQKVGIVGALGCGKSTIFKLILRLIHGAEGKIIVSSHPIEFLDRKSLSEIIAYISQTPFLFSGTLYENIVYGCQAFKEFPTIDSIPKKSRLLQLLSNVVKRVGLDVVNFSNGYNYIVEEHGKNLSGGQRQLVSFVRILLSDHKIILLDEATASLDNISEKMVQSALDEISQNKTTIVIAHRLTTLVNMDNILVLKGGIVIESGTYNELSNQNGYFKELLKAGLK